MIELLPKLQDSNYDDFQYAYTDTTCYGLYKPHGILGLKNKIIEPITPKNIGDTKGNKSSIDLEVYIDTNSQAIVRTNEWIQFYNNYSDSIPQSSICKCGDKASYKGYFVYILNNSNKKTEIDYYGNLQFIQEVLDRDNSWKPIEYQYSVHGHFDPIIVNANEALVTKMIKYQGDFKTKIRLRLLVNNNWIISNEILGTINEKQINK